MMADAAGLIVLVAAPAGFGAEVSGASHEPAFTELLNEALRHYMRDPGWFEVTLRETRFYACQLVTIPLLALIKNRVPARQLQTAAGRLLSQLKQDLKAASPAAWIMVNADFISPLPRPGVNLRHARKIKNSLETVVFTDPGDINAPEIKAARTGTEFAVSVRKENPPEPAKKEKKGPDADKVMERVMLGWRVRDICQEENCSESYVYKLIKKRKGSSAMDYRMKQWELISRMYHAEPKITVEEIEKVCGVSRAVIYHAVRKIARRDGVDINQRGHDRKLTQHDVESIKKKLSQGVLRKDILTEYGITNHTLLKYIGTHENYRVIPEELKEHAVWLRVQGKTLQQTAEILGVTVATIKRAWKKQKDSAEIKEKRVKYDNRNPLSRRDRDQAVNAVLQGGHTRKQIYTQYGINALTLRRYIRDAQKRETEKLRQDEKETDGQDKP